MHQKILFYQTHQVIHIGHLLQTELQGFESTRPSKFEIVYAIPHSWKRRLPSKKHYNAQLVYLLFCPPVHLKVALPLQRSSIWPRAACRIYHFSDSKIPIAAVPMRFTWAQRGHRKHPKTNIAKEHWRASNEGLLSESTTSQQLLSNSNYESSARNKQNLSEPCMSNNRFDE